MTKKQSRESRMESLLTAAIEEFVEKGYNGASMDSIAKRAGVSKGGLYHYFPTKEVLLMEANNKISEPISEMALKALASKSAIEGIRYYIRQYINYWIPRTKELSFTFLSMSKALESDILMDYFEEYVTQSSAFFVEMFRKAKNSGEINISDPEAYGISLMGALDGVLTYAVVHPKEDIATLCSRIEKVWIGGDCIG